MSSLNFTLPWSDIDTVLLDMDGTLLDLHFDNHFWCEHLVQRYALHYQQAVETSRTELAARFAAVQDTLDWYCLDYWTNQLGMDIVALKHETAERIRPLPHAIAFLESLRDVKQVYLLTNAHPASLALKLAHTGLAIYFDKIISSHEFHAPKETPEFWQQAELTLGFKPARSVFFDDSLPVLRAAQAYGIAHVIAMLHPDSTEAPRTVSEFQGIHYFDVLLPALTALRALPSKN
ncbi:MAG: GMP/IMP nucleotidase [Gammaproteobacteria bacterium]|nr:GMP/IMP nucleotidase [Gammaproteobacteria bacterium]